MRRFITAILLGMAQFATAGDSILDIGKCIRTGDTEEVLLCKTPSGSCYAVDISNIKAEFPIFWTPMSFHDALTKVINSPRSLTNQEFEDCNNRPVIALNGNPTVEVIEGGTYVDAGAVVTDTEDDAAGLVIPIIVAGLPIDTSTVGSHSITYSAVDSESKDAIAALRRVNVIASSEPPPPEPVYTWQIAYGTNNAKTRPAFILDPVTGKRITYNVGGVNIFLDTGLPCGNSYVENMYTPYQYRDIPGTEDLISICEPIP